MVGLRADAVDYAKWPQLSRDSLEAAFEEILCALESKGYRARWCLTGADADSPVDELRGALEADTPDVVLIGAGVRTDPDHLLLFERMINLVHEHAPKSRIAFNRLPFDSVEAVGRWMGAAKGSSPD